MSRRSGSEIEGAYDVDTTAVGAGLRVPEEEVEVFLAGTIVDISDATLLTGVGFEIPLTELVP